MMFKKLRDWFYKTELEYDLQCEKECRIKDREQRDQTIRECEEEIKQLKEELDKLAMGNLKVQHLAATRNLELINENERLKKIVTQPRCRKCNNPLQDDELGKNDYCFNCYLD